MGRMICHYMQSNARAPQCPEGPSISIGGLFFLPRTPATETMNRWNIKIYGALGQGRTLIRIIKVDMRPMPVLSVGALGADPFVICVLAASYFARQFLSK